MNGNVVLLDGIEKLEVEHQKYGNEIRNLRTLSVGLQRLAESIKRPEVHFERQTGGKLKAFSMGATSRAEEERLNMYACMFHWFGVTVINYARIVGFIRGIEKGLFSRADLIHKTKFDLIGKKISDYVSSIPELANVKVWRNKVSAHPAITDPYGDDNIATLDMSVIFPVTFEGKYVVGGMQLIRNDSTGTHVSALPRWSLTEVFESLIPRFWPNLSIEPGPQEPGCSADYTI
jgi:hypothetical protein